MDGDGDRDVLSASQDDDKIAWYENLDGPARGAALQPSSKRLISDLRRRFGVRDVLAVLVLATWSVDGDGPRR